MYEIIKEEKLRKESIGLKSKIRSFFTPTPKNNLELNDNFFKSILVWGCSQKYFRSHIVVWLLALSLVANAADWMVLAIFLKPVALPIILHYNVYFGVDLLGDWRQVYFLPAIGLFLLITNFSLSFYFYRQKERIASYLLLMAALMIQLSLTVAVASVVIINY